MLGKLLVYMGALLHCSQCHFSYISFGERRFLQNSTITIHYFSISFQLVSDKPEKENRSIYPILFLPYTTVHVRHEAAHLG